MEAVKSRLNVPPDKAFSIGLLRCHGYAGLARQTALLRKGHVPIIGSTCLAGDADQEMALRGGGKAGVSRGR